MIRFVLADRLRRFREDAGLTIYEVGNRIGKSGKTVSAWECGRGQPDADMLITLCQLYGIESIAELYGEDPATPSLTPDERLLVADYRDASDEIRAAVARMLHDSAESQRKEKSASTSNVG